VPHFAAKRLDSRASADAFLSGLREQAGVTRLMLIGGDTDWSAGPFDTALSVIESGLLTEHGIERVGLAGYPEGHPKIPEPVLEEALRAKLAAAGAAGLQPYVVTQFCFDGGTIVRWLRRMRAAGVASPIRVGAVGPAKIRSLLSYAARCGVTRSVRALWDGPVSLRELLTQHGPDELVAEVLSVALAEPLTGRLGLHLFSFGGFKAAAQWLRSVS
jgi:methylenetetrahydrofolate reductase (NADH)